MAIIYTERPPTRRVSKIDPNRVLQLRGRGQSTKEIADDFGVEEETILSVLKRAERHK